MFYSYLYIDPRTNKPFYVGKGKEDRCFQHLYRKDHCEFVHKIRKMISENVEPIIHRIECSSEEAAFDLECGLIKVIGRKDKGKGPLLNLTDGGEGTSGCLSMLGDKNPRYGDHRTWDEIHGKEKSSVMKKEMSSRVSGCKNNMFGKKREDLRERNLTNNSQKNPESREKNRISHLGKRFSQKTMTCEKCGKVGGIGNIKRYHMDNCKVEK